MGILALVLASLWCAPAISAQGAADILYITEEYPPFNYTKEDSLRGIAVDLLEGMLAQLQPASTHKPIKVFPWARGYHLVQHQEDTMLFSTSRTPQRENLFKWVGPIASNRIVVIARKDRRIAVKGLDDLRKFKIGAIRDDIGQHLLMQAGFELAQFDLVAAAAENVKKLDTGRIDAWVYGESVARWFIKQNGFDPEHYETVYLLQEIELYYAFHRATPDELVQQFQSALDRLKSTAATGPNEYDKIIQRYLGP